MLISDLALQVDLLSPQISLAHDLFVKHGSLLLETGLQKALPHLVDDFVNGHLAHAVELDPLAKEARS